MRWQMRMDLLELVRPVEIEGPSLFGPAFHRAKVVLSPQTSEDEFEWIYNAGSKESIRIDAGSVRACRFQNLAVLKRGHTVAHVLEHLLPLKAYGLLGLRMTSTHSLPYFGNAMPFLEHVLPASKEVVRNVSVKTVSRPCVWEYPYPRGGGKSSVTIRPRNDGRLTLRVSINYPGLGRLEKLYGFPDRELWKRIAVAKSQGWPESRYKLSKLVSSLGLWQHHDAIEWPMHMSKDVVLDHFVDHRALDLVAALGLLMNDCWLSADVVSVCAGHLADIEVCRIARHHLVPVNI